jgi:hypothetical protein
MVLPCCWLPLLHLRLPPPTGKGLDLVRMFYSLLPQRHRWVEAQGQAAEFIIDETFGVPGVGTVVAGASRGRGQHGRPVACLQLSSQNAAVQSAVWAQRPATANNIGRIAEPGSKHVLSAD